MVLDGQTKHLVLFDYGLFDKICDNIIRDISLKKWYYRQYSPQFSYKISTGTKRLHIRFDKIDGFIMVLDGQTKHLVLFDYGLFDKICDNIIRDISLKKWYYRQYSS